MYRAVDGSAGPAGSRAARQRGWDEANAGREQEPHVPGPSLAVAEGKSRSGDGERGPRRAWNPADGPPVDPRQRPPARAELLPDGSVTWKLWSPSEGPCRSDPGGAGGTPSGRAVPIHKVVWD